MHSVANNGFWNFRILTVARRVIRSFEVRRSAFGIWQSAGGVEGSIDGFEFPY